MDAMTIFFLFCWLTNGLTLAQEPTSLRAQVEKSNLSWPPPGLRIEIDKSDRRMRLFSEQTLLRIYPVALGFSPEGDKAVEGDGRTPLGLFRIVTRNPTSAYYKFMGLSYPTSEDASRGLKQGLITHAQAQAIREAEHAGRQPPWNTNLGGAIGLHGRGAKGDWTLGCVALEDAHMQELWEIGQLGLEVRIQE
jgi:murein L,D-transpeptidase YafK